MQQAEGSSAEDTSRQTGTHPEHIRRIQEKLIDGKEAGTLTYPEEPMPMGHTGDEGSTDASTTQAEVTSRTRTEESDEDKVVHSIEPQPKGGHMARSEFNGIDTIVYTRVRLTHLNCIVAWTAVGSPENISMVGPSVTTPWAKEGAESSTRGMTGEC